MKKNISVLTMYLDTKILHLLYLKVNHSKWQTELWDLRWAGKKKGKRNSSSQIQCTKTGTERDKPTNKLWQFHEMYIMRVLCFSFSLFFFFLGGGGIRYPRFLLVEYGSLNLLTTCDGKWHSKFIIRCFFSLFLAAKNTDTTNQKSNVVIIARA